jgi:SNF2 family DNA or RNA helicase
VDIINNRTKLLGDDLKNEINENSKMKIIASCFSIYAFDALKKELKDLEELKFIFSSPTFIEEKVADKIKKEKREFYIPHELRESSLYGTQFEVKLRNKLTQKAIARECAEWIRSKVKFKSNITGSAMPNFISVENSKEQVTYLPVNSFSTGELGYENDNALFQAITKISDGLNTTMFIREFEEIWSDEEKLEDVTDKIVDYIASAYNENPPEYIYFVILYNIFSEFLADLSEDYMPNELTGFKDSLIWNKLYNYQKDGAVGVINKLEKYNGCILADSVGLGKTFTALSVMHYYDLKNKSILVLCPKKLANNWNSYKGNTRTNIFFKDRIRFDVLYHTDLGRKAGKSNNIDLANVYWENYDLIVIDESHNFRNDYAFKGKETRYQFLMNKVIKKGVKTKVLMLSATPVNNKFKDLKNQLALAYGDDVEEFENKLGTDQSIRKIFLRAQKAFDAWSRLPQEVRKAKDLLDNLNIDFSILLDSVTIARSRKHIVKYYDTKDIGSFPARLKPQSHYCELTERQDVIKYDEIYKQITSMNMGLYAPTNYILSSKAAHYGDLYDTKIQGRGVLKQSSREKSLQRLMTIMMLKRLESSVESFRITLKNLLKYNKETLEKIYEHKRGNKVFIERNINEYPDVDEDDVALDGFSMGKGTTVGKIKIDLADMNLLGWERDLKSDIYILEFLIGEMEKIGVNEDSKLNQLKKVIDRKMENPINIGNKKVLIFSAFADTATYLYNNISIYVKRKYGLETAEVQG